MLFDVKINDEANVVLIVSPCRSGSTALFNCFVMAGARGFFQPIKSAVRRSVAGVSEPVSIELGYGANVIKETFGPFMRQESQFSAIATLLNSGLRRQQIKLLALHRDAKSTAQSWLKAFRFKKEAFALDWLAPSYRAVADEIVLAHHENILTTTIAYEDIASDTQRVLSKALRDLALPENTAVVDWTSSPHYTHGSFSFALYRDPDEYFVSGVLDGTKYGVGFEDHSAAPVVVADSPHIRTAAIERERLRALVLEQG